MSRLSFLAPLAAAICLFAAPAAAHDDDSVPGPAPDGKIVGGWTQFVANTQAGYPVAQPAVELRFVVQTTSTRSDADYCSDFAVVYQNSGGSKNIANGLIPRANPGKYNFPVAVCAMALDADWSNVKVIAAKGTVDDKALPIWDEDGPTAFDLSTFGPNRIGRVNQNVSGKAELKIITLGDTGCRGPHSNNRKLRQDCDDDATWPLAKISNAAAKYQPDLVVHSGDYRYYTGDLFADNWSYWLKDFVAPSRWLLLAAPWALARGNHEDCGSGGPGFFYLFGASAADKQCDANKTESWYFDVAPGGIDSAGKADAPHRFVMIDTSADSRSEAKANFETAIDVSNQPNTWWTTHIAPVHLINFGADPSQNTNIAAGLSDALNSKGTQLCDSNRQPLPTCIPSTLILGHDHMYQTVVFEDAGGEFVYPQMYIVGHGGVNLRGAGLKGSPCSFKFENLPGQTDPLMGKVTTRQDFGFVVWSRSLDTVDTPSGWVADDEWVSSGGIVGGAASCF